MEIAPSQPASFRRGRAAQLSLQFLFQQNTICSVSRGKCSPAALVGCSATQGPQLSAPSCPPAATQLGQHFLPVKLRHLPKHIAENIRVGWSVAFFKSHLRKNKSQCLHLPFKHREKKVLKKEELAILF